MRIFYVTDIRPDPTSVQTVHVDEVCKQFVKDGHIVTVFIPGSSSHLGDTPYKTRYFHVPAFGTTVWFQFRLLYTLLVPLRKNIPDLLYARHSLLLIVPFLVSRWYGIPLVLEVNGKLLEETCSRKNSVIGTILLHLGIYRWFESLNMKNATTIVCVTDGIRDYVVEKYAIKDARCHVVHNGVNPDLFVPHDRHDSRALLNLPDDAFYVGYVGSFFAWQGLRYVAEAARMLATEHPKIKFVITGAGDDKTWLMKFIKQHHLEQTLILRPAVTRSVVPLYITSFDICLCVPTRFREGSTSPFKIYEYLACSKAVIASDIAGMREEFADLVEYVEPESARALAECIVRLRADAKRIKLLGEVGRKTIVRNHTWKVTVQKILAHVTY